MRTHNFREKRDITFSLSHHFRLPLSFARSYLQSCNELLLILTDDILSPLLIPLLLFDALPHDLLLMFD
jgi:signal transduction histidine kinase